MVAPLVEDLEGQPHPALMALGLNPRNNEVAGPMSRVRTIKIGTIGQTMTVMIDKNGRLDSVVEISHPGAHFRVIVGTAVQMAPQVVVVDPLGKTTHPEAGIVVHPRGGSFDPVETISDLEVATSDLVVAISDPGEAIFDLVVAPREVVGVVLVGVVDG